MMTAGLLRASNNTPTFEMGDDIEPCTETGKYPDYGRDRFDVSADMPETYTWPSTSARCFAAAPEQRCHSEAVMSEMPDMVLT